MEIMTILANVLNQRPNARVLILEAFPQDAAMLADHILAHPPKRNLSAGCDHRDQVLVMALSHYSANKRRMGPVDVCIVHQRYNMHRVDSDKRWKGVRRYFEKIAMPRPIVHVMEPEPILGLEPARRTWRCGEPFPMRSRAMGLIAQEGEYTPCGAENPKHCWFCQECGTFRGLIYRGF
jgi:hypothetical protein